MSKYRINIAAIVITDDGQEIEGPVISITEPSPWVAVENAQFDLGNDVYDWFIGQEGV